MTFNNETVYRQKLRAGNIAKTMTSNWKQFTAYICMLPAKCWPLLHVIRACSWRWPDAQPFFHCFSFVVLYSKSKKMTGPLGNSEFCFPRISMFPETNEILGSCSSRKVSHEWLATIWEYNKTNNRNNAHSHKTIAATMIKQKQLTAVATLLRLSGNKIH